LVGVAWLPIHIPLESLVALDNRRDVYLFSRLIGL